MVSVLSVIPQFKVTRIEIEKPGYLKFLSQFQRWGGNAEALSLLVQQIKSRTEVIPHSIFK